ncbi:RNA methyltransferase [Gaiella sp.]|uniref:TrmH family RNA methyltransferase n=1 Tax=Gaiella sp. TaxID=2663207 RepID=UPI002E3240E2|nr:RNA methyltransferase [Gaiella sp.]HEX5582685.1 RNA methyltransferase [Gaiella sp.]
MITSRDNATLTLVRKLLRGRKHREESGLFAAEGEDLVTAARAAQIEPVHLLVAGETVEETLLARVSTLPHPARAIGVYRRADLPAEPRPVCLALWRLADPGNIGTLVRTADAFDASVALSPGCADPLSPKALRASAGAIFRVPLVPWDELPGTRVALVAHGGEPLSGLVSGLDLSPPLTLLLGAEREGLPEELATQCHKVTIELPGAAESLNVAAAGAVALYALARSGEG